MAVPKVPINGEMIHSTSPKRYSPSARPVAPEPGTGINLGAHTEFREGAEFDYRFDNMNRVGVGMYHMSNAGIGKQNPGVELVMVVLTMPLPFR